ncbi:MAG: hypothetical protein U5Q03_17445 [Bacteroidota bacterium]|nr:hypothetical protein [Bacteroidota bacterium]
MYYRIVELCIIQRASQLKFADEVSYIFSPEPASTSQTANEVRSLYRASINIVNNIQQSIPQEQGREIYESLKVMNIPEHVKDLESEIGESHSYLSLREIDKGKQTKTWQGLQLLVPCS